ncbi:MAG: membrane-bound ClpP family serine protease [Chlamydiales bacterium]|jgi:membrane-bound ClpP family serine protease
MIVPYVMLGVGLLLIYMEFYLPGGIMGTCGSILLVMGVVFFSQGSENPLHVMLFTVGAMVGLAFVVMFALNRIKSADPESSVYLSDDQEGYRAPTFSAEAVGKMGSVLTDMKPSGHILIEGKQFQAVSKTGYLLKGSEVIVTGGKGAYLFVKPCKKENYS